MKHADQVLEDELLVATVYEALAKRRPPSRTPQATRNAGGSGDAPRRRRDNRNPCRPASVPSAEFHLASLPTVVTFPP